MSTNSNDVVAATGPWSSQLALPMPGFSHSTWNSKDEAHSNAHKAVFTCDKYLRGSILGQGAWSSVHKIKRVADGELFAGKASCDEQLKQEIEILLKFRHNHILKFVELHQQGDAPGAKILVTELCAWGDLSEHIHHVTGGMGKMDILLVMSQIGDALAFIHGNNYYHSDIKPRNILIRKLKPFDVVLADCADCRVCGTEIYGNKNNRLQAGTYKFWSPEMTTSGLRNGKEDDIWALGITLLDMMAQLPRLEITQRNRNKIHRDVYKHAKRCAKHARDLRELNPEDELVKLVGRMLIRASFGRIPAADCSHEAKKLLEELDMDMEESNRKGTEGLGLESPEGFRPPSFW
ncbi:kinase-like domain-containing protein [Trichoderma compactum]